MIKANYWQRGESLDIKNKDTEIIEAGTVIDLKTRIGVAGTDIVPNGIGSVHVAGVYEIAKTADTDTMEMGDLVYFDGTGITVNNSDTPAGYAAQDSESGTATVYVKLLG